MGNKDDSNALRTQAIEQGKKMLDFLRRQTRCRLVKDDEAGIVPGRTGDLYHLSLCRAQAFNQSQWVHVEIQRLLRLLCGDIDLAIDGKQLLHPEFKIL